MHLLVQQSINQILHVLKRLRDATKEGKESAGLKSLLQSVGGIKWPSDVDTAIDD